MLELIDELRAHAFTVGIVTGGGTEFVRRVSASLDGVSPERVVGTLIGYEFCRDTGGRPLLRRTVSLMGSANEGAAKVEHIQSQLGRAPIVAAGGGDREMLEWIDPSAAAPTDAPRQAPKTVAELRGTAASTSPRGPRPTRRSGRPGSSCMPGPCGGVTAPESRPLRRQGESAVRSPPT